MDMLGIEFRLLEMGLKCVHQPRGPIIFYFSLILVEPQILFENSDLGCVG